MKRGTSRNTLVAAARARREFAELVATLAPDGCCASCGDAPEDGETLQIDHVDGRTWEARRLNRWTRVKRYWTEFRSGVRLRALCRYCNGAYRPPGRNASGHRCEDVFGAEVVPF